MQRRALEFDSFTIFFSFDRMLEMILLMVEVIDYNLPMISQT